LGSTKWSLPNQLSNISLLRKPVHHAVVELMPMRRNMMSYYDIHALLHMVFFIGRIFLKQAKR